MMISHLPQLLVKSSVSEHTSGSNQFLEPPIPRMKVQRNSISKCAPKDLDMIVESDDFPGEDDDPILEDLEHEHEVIE